MNCNGTSYIPVVAAGRLRQAEFNDLASQEQSRNSGPGIAAVTRWAGRGQWGPTRRAAGPAGTPRQRQWGTSNSSRAISVARRAISDAPIPGALRALLHTRYCSHDSTICFMRITTCLSRLSRFVRNRSLLTRISFRTFLNIQTPFGKSSP